ncbi:MAG: flagellar hook-associated protein FlgK [Acidovorax sp.]
MSLLNVGARALMANQIALQTIGNNISNVSTPGYSRQSAQLVTALGQYSPQGYIGQGVDVQTILRSYDALLTKQAAAAGAVSAGDKARSDSLNQLQNTFTGGDSGLGQAITDVINALQSVQSTPTDLTARNVALTRMNELAGRFQSASSSIEDLANNTNQQIQNDVKKVNDLAQSLAAINQQIANARGTGQSPNDLLDKRDQYIREINQYVGTTQVMADDGTVSLFVANQPLVMGNTAATLSISEDSVYPGSGQQQLYLTQPTNGATPVQLTASQLSGGEVAGLMSFMNNDLAAGRNLLGRMAQAIGMVMNQQNSMGLTLDGNAGGNLFNVPTSVTGRTSSATAAGTVGFVDPTQFAASDYQVQFTSGTTGQVIRLSDGKATSFSSLTDPALSNIDGLQFNLTAGGAAGDAMLFKPFGGSAGSMQAVVTSPRDLAAANPVNASMGANNNGTMQLVSLQATGLHWDTATNAVATTPTTYTAPPNGTGVVLTFSGAGTFTIAGNTDPNVVDMSTSPPSQIAGPPYSYVSGHAISVDGWQITLQGTPNAGDTVTVGNALDPQYGDNYTRDAGNAAALVNLGDKQMFDTASMTDGWASAMAAMGTRVQSAQYSSDLSSTIASNLESSRTSVSGVNLDEEAAKLIQFQQAYQASAKMLQISQTIFDSLIQSTGR